MSYFDQLFLLFEVIADSRPLLSETRNAREIFYTSISKRDKVQQQGHRILCLRGSLVSGGTSLKELVSCKHVQKSHANIFLQDKDLRRVY